MLRDKENHRIELGQNGNGHVLAFGKSGQGKTYFLCRMLEKYCEMEKEVLVIDFSGSYSAKELCEKGFKYEEKVKRYVLSRCDLEWRFRVCEDENFQKDVTEALLESLKCTGYFQKKLLSDVVGNIVKNGKKVNLANIMKELEDMFQKEQELERISGNRDNVGRLLTRLAPYADITNFSVIQERVMDKEVKPITIIDLTNFPEIQRKFLTEFIVSMLWREIYRQESRNRCNVLLLDEIQFLSVKEKSTLSAMLREGRKKNLDVVLATQFVSHYSKAEIQALQQADNMVVFRPTPEDCKRTARMIDSAEEKAWEKILQGLKKGEAVLKGNYRIDGRSRLSFDPIVIKIVKK